MPADPVPSTWLSCSRFARSYSVREARRARSRSPLALAALLLVTLPGFVRPALAQEAAPPVEAGASSTSQLLPLPKKMPAAPQVKAAPKGQYVLEFNRSPVVGNRLRFTGIYDERRLHFTRPRNWQPLTVKVLVRYRHSAALYATRSNLTVLLNGTSVGSLPLNKRQGEIGEAVFNVPLDLLQDHNELLLTALQNNSPTCTQDPYDPSLWTEVLPDSKLVFDFQPQPVTPDFRQFPYPLFDTLSLQTNQIAYLLPQHPTADWLTPAARLQVALGRVAQYRPLDTRLIKTLSEVTPPERVVIVGTPQSQPALSALVLPFALKAGQFQDGEGKPLSPDVGLLMWTTTAESRVPVLVATGNGAAGVAKAVQFLVQPGDAQIGVGHGLLISQVSPLASPPPRQWPGYLPTSDTFTLAELETSPDQPIADVTVRGSQTQALEVDFKALPDDRFEQGNEMVLRYSYGPQINPLTSLVEVVLDGVALDGKRLASVEGAKQQSFKIDLPAAKITPQSRLRINFRLDPRERRSCSRVTDQQLWGTIHADTRFQLKRQAIATLPDLKLLSTGFPFTAPQDLSTTALVVPNAPSKADLDLLMALAERLGRLSKADSVHLEVFRVEDLPESVKRDRNLIALGPQSQFPLPDVWTSQGFGLRAQLTRQWGNSQVQTLPDNEGVMKTILSPWNRQRVVLALSAQAETGLAQLRDLVQTDSLFYQLTGDTALISANRPDPDPGNPQDYQLEFLRQSPSVQQATAPSQNLLRRLRTQGLVLVPGFVVLTLLFYGLAQSYLNRSDRQEETGEKE